MKILVLLLLCFPSVIFSQQNTTLDYNATVNEASELAKKEFSKLFFEIEDSQNKFLMETNKKDKSEVRDWFDKSLSLINRLEQFSDNEFVSFETPSGKILSVSTLEIKGLLFHYKNFVKDWGKMGIEYDNMPEFLMSPDNISYNDRFIQFLIEFDQWLRKGKHIINSDWRSSDTSSFLSSLVSSELINALFPTQSKGLSKDIVLLENVALIKRQIDLYIEDNMSAGVWGVDALQAFYALELELHQINIKFDPKFKEVTGSACGLLCEMNILKLLTSENISTDSRDKTWFISSQLRYLDFLADYLTFSQSGTEFTIGISLDDAIKEMEHTIDEIDLIISGKYDGYTSQANDTMRTHIDKHGYPTVGYNEYIAKTKEEYLLQLELGLFSNLNYSITEMLEDGYQEEAFKMLNKVINIIKEMDYSSLSTIAKNDPIQFDYFFEDISMLKLVYMMVALGNMANNSNWDDNQIGLPKEDADELRSSIHVIDEITGEIDKIAAKHKFQDKVSEKGVVVMENLFSFVIDIMESPPVIMDLSKMERKMLPITRPLGKKESKGMTEDVLLGMISSHWGIIKDTPNFKYTKMIEERMNQTLTAEAINDYVSYNYRRILINVMIEIGGINENTTQEEFMAIMNDFASGNFEKEAEKYDDEINEEYKKIIKATEKGIKYIVENTLVQTIQQNPEGFSETIKVIKKLFLMRAIEDDTSYDDMLIQLMILNKLNTILEYDESPNIFLIDYLSISNEEFEKTNRNISYTVIELGIPIIQTFFIEEMMGLLDWINATYFITKSSDPERPIQIYKEPILHETINNGANLNTKINLLTANLGNNFDATDTQKELYNRLILPTLEFLELTDDSNLDIKPYPIVYITDAITHPIPLDALIDNKGNYLLDSFIFIRSNSLLKLMDFNSESLWMKDKKLLLAGDINYENSSFSEKRIKEYGELDNLEWSLAEMKAINSVRKNSDIYSNLSESNLKELRFQNFNSLHFSTHGISVYSDFKKSALFLHGDDKNDGILTYDEIKQLDLTNVDFVFLSACETNVGKKFTNINPITLQTAFHQAGVNSSISTLWSIDDKATSSFTKLFYDVYNDTDFRFVALHQAKRLFIIKFPEYSHPYYWSAFTLDGF